MFNNKAFNGSTIEPMQPSMVFLYKVASEKRQVHKPAAVGRVMGVSSQRLKNWEARGISKEGALIAQAMFGIDCNELLALNTPTDGLPMAYATNIEPVKGLHQISEKRAERGQPAWPFDTVTPEQWEALTQSQKIAVEAVACGYIGAGATARQDNQPANKAAAA